jgi:hypothetical protein
MFPSIHPSICSSIHPTQLICLSCLEHPHHTLFIILALVNANKDESFSRSRLSKSTPRHSSQLDLVSATSI